MTAIANCFYDSVPTIFLTGQVNTRFISPTRALRQTGFQECDIVAMARPITKSAVLIRDPKDVEYELDKALWLCLTGRPGPVLLDLPTDVQKAEFTGGSKDTFAPLYPTSMNGDKMDKFLADFQLAHRPVILVGGGVHGRRARETLNTLAEALRVPLFPTWNALDVVPSDHPWYGGRIGTYGGQGRNFAVQNSDLLLAIGCRLSGRITGGQPTTFARGARRYVVDLDPGLLDSATQQQPFHVNIDQHAVTFMSDLEMTYRRRRISGDSFAVEEQAKWWTQVQRWRDIYDPVLTHKNSCYPYIRGLSRCIPANAVIVTDCGGNVVTLNHAFEIKTGQRYFSSNGNSPMGFALAGAIGAWHADPHRPVYCFIGDGGFAMSAHELAMLKQTEANVLVFVLNNHGYGITRAFQETHNAGRAEASTPASGVFIPNILTLAEAYSIPAFDSRVMTQQQLVNFRGPAVFDVDLGNFHDYRPRISGWDTPIEDMFPYLPRAEFRANMIGVEPMPGWEKNV